MMVQLTLSNIAVLLLTLGLASSQAFKICRPGEVWKEECNKCACTSAGIPRCTSYSCPPDAYHNTKKLGDCKPLSRWRVDCNYCECTETGEISCTNNICSANELASDRFKREVKRCQPGSKWKDECNDCVCTHTGYPSCTLKACGSQSYILPIKKTKRESGQQAEEITVDRETREVKKCQPGSKWKDECNDCVCTHTGYPSCTLKACDSQSYIIPNKKPKREADQNAEETTFHRKTREVKKCQPGSKWKDDCNDCVCTHTGYPSCTLKACASQTYIIPNSKSKRSADEGELGTTSSPQIKSCKPGISWKDDCNKCVCTAEGKPRCTEMLCFPTDLPVVKDRRDVRACKPGEYWKEDCNHCYCSSDGKPKCTRKGCPPQIENLQIKAKRSADGGACKPGESWREDCNTCFCGENGEAACTLKACPSDHQYLPIKLKRSTEACQPGSTWKEDCNDCHCSQDGKPACTLKACLNAQNEYHPLVDTIEGPSTETPCQPGTSWKQDCNSCFCSDDGKAACTLKACSLDHGSQYLPIKQGGPIDACQPGSTWKEDCNDCHCSQDGKPACTLKACPSQTMNAQNEYHPIVDATEETPCQPGTSWKQDCNSCFCTDDGKSACTFMACLTDQLLPIISSSAAETPSCKPGDQWKEDCNTCTCTKTGLPVCTKKACLPEEKGARKRREACKPGDQWKEGCNTCTCTKQGNPACTKKACLPEEMNSRRKRETCTPGATWKNGCNSCFCTQDGTAACTRKLCTPEEEGSPIRRKRATCTPGEKWKESCNSCYCLATGQASCTWRACRRRRDTECRPSTRLCGSPRESDSNPRRREGRKLRGRGRCTPGSRWEQNCSTCFCDEQGNVGCVDNRTCREEEDSKRTKEGAEGLKGRGRCEPGSTWQLLCNTCSCDQNGNMKCTDYPCDSIEDLGEKETRKKRSTGANNKQRWCKPGDSMYFNCDKCPCGARGITGCNYRTSEGDKSL